MAMLTVPALLKTLMAPPLLTATSTRFATTEPVAGLRLDVPFGLVPPAGNSVRYVPVLGAIAVTFTTTALTPVAGTFDPLMPPTCTVRVALGPSAPIVPEPESHWLGVIPDAGARVSQMRNGATT